MLSSIGSSSLTSYTTDMSTMISSPVLNIENLTQDFEDSYSPSMDLKGLFDHCTWDNIDSLEDYIKTRGSGSCETQSKLQSEFQEYMKFRGCDNESELQALNSANANNANGHYTTKQDLIFTANLRLAQADGTLWLNGYTSTNIPEQDRNSILSTANLQDIADFVNSCDRNQSATNEIASFKKFLGAVESTDDSLSDTLKSRISTILQNMSDNWDAIAAFTEKIDKEAEVAK